MEKVFVLAREVTSPPNEYTDEFITGVEKIAAFPTKEAARITMLALLRGEIEILTEKDEDRVDYYIWEIPLFEGKTELLSKHPDAHLGDRMLGLI